MGQPWAGKKTARARVAGQLPCRSQVACSMFSIRCTACLVAACILDIHGTNFKSGPHKCLQAEKVRFPAVTVSTVQYSTVQYSTVQYSTVQYSTVQYSTVQYSTVQYMHMLHTFCGSGGPYQDYHLILRASGRHIRCTRCTKALRFTSKLAGQDYA